MMMILYCSHFRRPHYIFLFSMCYSFTNFLFCFFRPLQSCTRNWQTQHTK